jgi:serine/threonine protein kinase
LPEGLRLIRPLGQSPLSIVLLVEDPQGERFALKVLRPSVAKDKRIQERWRREAKLLDEIRHPNLVRSYGACEVEGRPALLLEYIAGKTLRARLEDGPLGWEQAARFGVQVSRALEKLHKSNAIHRDVKPHNILLHPVRGAILADLGLVRSDEDPTMTRHGAALGSPAYMSPEQARDPSEVDSQADIYSLGATLFHTVSGTPPFLGSGVGEVIHRVMHEEPEPLPDHLPLTLGKVIATAMAKDPERRYARARDFGSDLGRVLLGYPPRLFTAHRRRQRLQRSIAAAATLLVVAGLWWWSPWQATTPVNPDLIAAESSEDNGEGELTEGALAEPQPTSPNHPEVDEFSAEQFFQYWSTAFENRFQEALLVGRFRDALTETDLALRAAVPKDAPVGFLEARREWGKRHRTEIAAAAERMAGQAMDMLVDQANYARETIDRGAFDAMAWQESVLDLWRRAGLRLDDMPLHPGSPDPVGRLKMTRASLENEDAQERIRRALQMVAPIRINTGTLLRAGEYQQALERWNRVDSVVFIHSSEARTDLARIEGLVALERRLQTALREKVGQPVDLILPGGSHLEGQLLASSDGKGYEVNYHGQTMVAVKLADLDPGFVVDWLESGDGPWLAAHLAWSQGDVTSAWNLMRALDHSDSPVEWQVEQWIKEWQAEAQEGLHQASTSTNPTIAGTDSGPDPETPLSDLNPAQRLQRAILTAKPEATTVIQGKDVLVFFEDMQWQDKWELNLGAEASTWLIRSWELSWELDERQSPPSKLTLQDDIALLHSSRRNPPQMRIDGKRFLGFGIAAGQGLQKLRWQNDALDLDGLPICNWQPSSARRARFEMECADGLKVARFSLRFEPR